MGVVSVLPRPLYSRRPAPTEGVGWAPERLYATEMRWISCPCRQSNRYDISALLTQCSFFNARRSSKSGNSVIWKVWCHRQAPLEFYTTGLIKCFSCSVAGKPWRHLLGGFRISKCKRIRTGFATNATDTRLAWRGWIQAEYTTGSQVYDTQHRSYGSAYGIWKMKRKKSSGRPMWRWVGSLKNNHKLGVRAWTEFECLTTGSNGGCGELRNEPCYTKSTVLATSASISFSLRALLHGRKKELNQTSWLTELERCHRSHADKFSRLHLIHCPYFNTGVHDRYDGDCHGQSVYSPNWILCTNWENLLSGPNSNRELTYELSRTVSVTQGQRNHSFFDDIQDIFKQMF